MNFISLQIWFGQQPSFTEQWWHLPHLPLWERSPESSFDAMLLFGESQVCPPGLPATVADCFRNEFLRIMQISFYNAYENQTIQRGQYTYSTQQNRIANENCKTKKPTQNDWIMLDTNKQHHTSIIPRCSRRRTMISKQIKQVKTSLSSVRSNLVYPLP